MATIDELEQRIVSLEETVKRLTSLLLDRPKGQGWFTAVAAVKTAAAKVPEVTGVVVAAK